MATQRMPAKQTTIPIYTPVSAVTREVKRPGETWNHLLLRLLLVADSEKLNQMRTETSDDGWLQLTADVADRHNIWTDEVRDEIEQYGGPDLVPDQDEPPKEQLRLTDGGQS